MRQIRPMVVQFSVLIFTVLMASCDRTPNHQPTAPSTDLAVNDSTQVEFLQADEGNVPIPGQYIVIFDQKSPPTDIAAAAESIASAVGGTRENTFSVGLVGFVLKLPANASGAITQIRQMEGIAYIEQDRILHPDNTQTNAPWSLDRIDQDDLPLTGDYIYDYDGTGVNVYIIDSGVETTDGDLSPRASGWWTYDSSHQPNDDCIGHGTAVASVAAGSTFGVAKNASMYSLRIDDCDSGASASDIVDAINQVAAYHSPPAVANLSYGGDATSIKDAIENAIQDGVSFVTSAGNDTVAACNDEGNNALGVVVVAASDINDNRADFSNYGSCVDLFAPGDSVPTTSGYWDGTSFSAPQYAGTAALHLERWPSDDPFAVKEAVVGSATDKYIGDSNGSPSLLLYTRGPRLSVNFEGPRAINTYDYCLWTADADGGRQPYSYQWSGFLSGTGQSVSGNSGSSAPLKLEVWDADGRYESHEEWIYVDSGYPMACSE